jgi:hypothetical protein
MENSLDINKISAEVISELAKSMSLKVVERCKNYISGTLKKNKIDFGNAYTDYLNYAKSTHEKIKTLLYRRNAKDIYSFYECVRLRRGSEVVDASDVNNVLNIGKKIIITGTGGIGKSVMMKHFFLNVIQSTGYIPILIELRGLNEFDEKDVNLFDYIYRVMENLKLRIEKEYFKYSLETGCYVVLLDGFDEVKNEISKQVTSQIFSLSEKYPDNHYIVTSRQSDEFIGWNQFEEIHSMPLSKKQALSLIQKIEYDENIKNKFYKELDKYLYDKYKTFASNPLLLTIMLLTFENRLSIPDKLNDFFEQAFTTLFHAHDATKGGYKRYIQSKLGYEDFKSVFSYFCFKSFFKSDYEFSEDKVLEYIGFAKKKNIVRTDFDSSDFLKDLVKSVCMLVREGLEYRFSHRSFQEYFAALYTTQLDDSQQEQFLKSWLKDNKGFISSSNYLDMLYEIQPRRFVKNVIAPGIRELKELFLNNGESEEWLIYLIYKSIMHFTSEVLAVINNNYYYNMLKMTCIIGGQIKNEDYAKIHNNIETDAKLIKILEENYYSDTTLEQLKNDGHMELVLEYFDSVIEQYKFAVKYIENIDKDILEGKDSFSSMLDEL